MSARETPDARAMRITAELRAATMEAAGVLKDLDRAVKAAKASVDEYVDRRFAARLSEVGDRTRATVEELQEKFVADFKQVRAEACEMAKAHMAEDWRLACAVNTVGHQVFEALAAADALPDVDAHDHPELKNDLDAPSWSPKGVSNG